MNTSGPMSQAPPPHPPRQPSLSHYFASNSSTSRLHNLASNTSTTPLHPIETATSAHTQLSSSSAQHTRSILGLHPQAPIDPEHDNGPAAELLWSRVRTVLREPFAEFWGVAIMVLFGDGSVAQVLLSAGQADAPGGNGFGAYQSINWG